ncbi:MAG: NAD(P)/FAD-dependent oxidoreductase [Pirellulales bacterium]
MQAATDLIVVGAGIGGAVLALALGRRGWKVKLLEREQEPPRIARPEILWSATLAALEPLNVADRIRREASVRVDAVVAARGDRRLLAIDREVLDAAGADPHSTDPAATRALIAEAALATGNVAVVRGAQVTGLIYQGHTVVGVSGRRDGSPFEEAATIVVGDDGVHSVVRESCGILIELEVFPLDFVTAGIEWPDDLAAGQVRIWMNPASLRDGIPVIGAFPWPGRRGVVLLPIPHPRAERLLENSQEHFWRELAMLTPIGEPLARQLRFPGDFKRVRRPYGHATSYVAGGAAIIGDAAHPMSPASGQGANASIWDALALAQVAHEALAANDPSRDRLARYEALRRSSNEASVRISRRAARILATASRLPALEWLVPTALRLVDRAVWFKRRFLSAAASTFVTRETMPSAQSAESQRISTAPDPDGQRLGRGRDG